MEKTPQKKRRERIARIVAGVVAALIAVGLLLYYVPWPQRIRIDGDAYRVDRNADSDTSYTMSLDATRLHYLFRSDRLTGHVTIRPAGGGDVAVDHDLDRPGWYITDVTQPGTKDTVSYFCGFWVDYTGSSPDMTTVSGLLSADRTSMLIEVNSDQGRGVYIAPASDEQSVETIKTELGKVFDVDGWIDR
ncbi:hypothetical protein DSM100688_0052 [Bifidobacterium ramosum]|uniref:Uncharacterized protein n=1 Tax=Bifidobacterium ramosum TaxID=1798158 RepID=A0A6L4X2H7_9BIFI|nr:hypothetical protein [Bifidobacterium ramosum]KAB8288974.1 hypothetical protein DSM100688_0052 [Bifidobacterium ramosum]NEG70690.1 hypothetical protein [Bifidobacterium ramosum]